MIIMKTEHYHEDYGDCLFFHFNDFESPPEVCCDSPLMTGFDEEYWTHFDRDYNFNELFDHVMK